CTPTTQPFTLRHRPPLPYSSVSCPPPLFLHHTPPTPLYTLSLHDALPIYPLGRKEAQGDVGQGDDMHHHPGGVQGRCFRIMQLRSEEHTSELQSREKLVCRLLLEKKNDEHVMCLDRMGR